MKNKSGIKKIEHRVRIVIASLLRRQILAR